MHLVPAPAVRLMKRRVQSSPGVRQQNNPKKENVVSRLSPADKLIVGWGLVHEHEPARVFLHLCAGSSR